MWKAQKRQRQGWMFWRVEGVGWITQILVVYHITLTAHWHSRQRAKAARPPRIVLLMKESVVSVCLCVCVCVCVCVIRGTFITTAWPFHSKTAVLQTPKARLFGDYPL